MTLCKAWCGEIVRRFTRRSIFWPSGLLGQFTNGRFGYVLASEPTCGALEEVDLFAPADAKEIGTVEQQRESALRFYGLRHQRS
ncbi:hypothetical protein ABZ793_23800 [Micromonospora sp. NPDC047465]|uniref:hypothetical protein n=1 Tax=Micromonospora sp. NPDC047465 TaxID=3154813 RepID=UPI0033E13921